MADLVERYIYEVGRYLPKKERAEIQAELRSQIIDQLEDRYGPSPTTEETAAILRDLGHPRQMAASYGSQQYLIGPDLYPVMMYVLRFGWVAVPAIAAFVNVFAALVADGEATLPGLLVRALLGAAQATFIFTGVVVLVFAILQHSGEDLDEITGQGKAFDPLALPEVDDANAVDRFEAAFGVAFGAFATLILLYFLRVGGLTLRFNLSDPGEVLPVPIPWLILLILNTIALIALNLVALRRNHWTFGTKLAEIALESFGAICLYFAVLEPLLSYLFAAVPALAGVPIIERLPLIIAVLVVVTTVAGGAVKLAKMWAARGDAPSYHVKTGS